MPGLRPATQERSLIERSAITEELYHAIELQDLEACMSDGYGRPTTRTGIVYTTPEATKEAHMNTHNDRKSGPDRSMVRVRPGGTRARMPWRDDCRIEPRSLTMAPDPEAKAISSDDARLLAKRPVNPATRKAEPVVPDGVWSLDDLIDDRRLVRNGC